MVTGRPAQVALTDDRCISGGLRFLAEMAAYDVLDEASRDVARQQYADIVELASGRRLKLAVVGEFSAGKSTLINALLGVDLLASDIEPTTAVATHLTWGPSFQVEIAGPEGLSRLCDVRTDEHGRPTREALRGVISHLRRHEGRTLLNADGSLPTDSRPLVAEFIRAATTEQAHDDGSDEVIIRLPSDYLAGAVDLLDTPGFNPGLDDAAKERHRAVTMRCVEASHLALFVIDGRNPLKATEQRYLEALKPYLSRIFFVVNKMDALVDEDDDDDEAIDTEEYIHEELPGKFGLSPDEATVYFVSSIADVPDAARRYTDELRRLREDVISFMGRSREAIVMEKTARYLTQSAEGVHEAVLQRVKQQTTKLAALQSKQIIAPEEMAQKVIATAMPAFVERGAALLGRLPQVVDAARRQTVAKFDRQLTGVTDKPKIKQAAIEAAGGTFRTYFEDPLKRHVVDELAEAIRAALRAMDREFRQLYEGIRTAQPGGPSKSAILAVANEIVRVQAAGGAVGRVVANERAKGVAWEVAGGTAAGVIGVALLGPIGIGLFGLGRVIGSAMGPSADEMKSKASAGYDTELRKKGPTYIDLARGCVSGQHAQFNELLNQHAHDLIDRYTERVQALIRAHARELDETKQVLASLSRSARQARGLAADAAGRAEEIRSELATARIEGQVDRTLVLDQPAIDSIAAGLAGSVINGAHDIPEKVESWYGGRDCVVAGAVEPAHEAAVGVAKGLRALIDAIFTPALDGPEQSHDEMRLIEATGLSLLDIELVLARGDGASGAPLDFLLALAIAEALPGTRSADEVDEPNDIESVVECASSRAAFWLPAVWEGIAEQNSGFVDQVASWALKMQKWGGGSGCRRFVLRAALGGALAASILIVLGVGLASGVIAWGVNSLSARRVQAAASPTVMEQQIASASADPSGEGSAPGAGEAPRSVGMQSSTGAKRQESKPPAHGSAAGGGGNESSTRSTGVTTGHVATHGGGKPASSVASSGGKGPGRVAGAAVAAAGNGEISISHAKPKSVYMGETLSLSVCVENARESCQVKVYYKDGIDWTSRSLRRGAGGRYSTTLDSENLMTSFEYYFKASCGAEQVRSGSRSSPHRVRIL